MVAEDYFGSILKSTKVATFVELNPQMFKLLWILFFAHDHKNVVLVKKGPRRGWQNTDRGVNPCTLIMIKRNPEGVTRYALLALCRPLRGFILSYQ